MRAVQAAKRIVRDFLGPRDEFQHIFFRRVKNRMGLEIGGPSVNTFGDSGILPLYRYVKNLDNCVFSTETLWDGQRAEGRTFSYHPRKPMGSNFILESTDLRTIKNHSYDFILASHTLEHTANPIKALKEWIRVTKPGGAVIVILPHYRYTFDHRRQLTPIGHMMEDYEREIDETDQTHLNEILELHDLSRDPSAGTYEQFRARSLRNLENRCLHQHVFDDNNSRELLSAAGLDVQVLRLMGLLHIVMLAQACTSSRSDSANSLASSEA